MGTIRFSLQTDVKDNEGRHPIQLVYQMHSERKRKSTGQKAYKENWSQDDQRAIYVKKGKLMDEDIKKINSKLQDIRRDIEKIETRLEANEIDYNIEMVLDELAGIKTAGGKKGGSSKELFAFIDRYIQDHEHTRIKGTLSVYKSLKRYLEQFERIKGYRVTFNNIDFAFFQSFQNFLVGVTKKDKDGNQSKRLNNITISKQLSTLKTLLNHAKAQGIDVPKKYEAFKVKRETDLEVITLTRKEFETLYKADFSNRPAWDQVRDVFCFSCATGLRYSDLKQLRWDHIRGDQIDLTAIKTSHKTMIPLNPYSKAILKKYAKEERPLPVISNQKSNEHMNEICKWAGFTNPIVISRKHGKDRIDRTYKKYELVRLHCGRKTFASLSLEQGMRAEYVMKIGGWKDYKSFKRYMNITDDSTKVAMEQAWGGKAISPKLKAV